MRLFIFLQHPFFVSCSTPQTPHLVVDLLYPRLKHCCRIAPAVKVPPRLADADRPTFAQNAVRSDCRKRAAETPAGMCQDNCRRLFAGKKTVAPLPDSSRPMLVLTMG